MIKILKLDKKINLALVGFGRFGKKYYQNLKKTKLFFIKKIFRKKKLNNQRLHKILKSDIKNKNFEAGIIATPTNTHYQISKLFIKNKIPIILEKPAGFNILEVKKMIQLSKQYKSTVIVNHSDLFNENLKYLLSKLKLIGKISFIEGDFGKFDNAYKDINYLPFYDWMPHPLAILFSISSKLTNLVIEHNYIKRRHGSFFQDIIVTFESKKIKLVRIKCSNRKKIKTRKLVIYGAKGLISYDGYNHNNNYIFIKRKIICPKTNTTPMQSMIKYLHHLSASKIFYSDLNLSLKIQGILEEIKSRLARKNFSNG